MVTVTETPATQAETPETPVVLVNQDGVQSRIQSITKAFDGDGIYVTTESNPLYPNTTFRIRGNQTHVILTKLGIASVEIDESMAISTLCDAIAAGGKSYLKYDVRSGVAGQTWTNKKTGVIKTYEKTGSNALSLDIVLSETAKAVIKEDNDANKAIGMNAYYTAKFAAKFAPAQVVRAAKPVISEEPFTESKLDPASENIAD